MEMVPRYRAATLAEDSVGPAKTPSSRTSMRLRGPRFAEIALCGLFRGAGGRGTVEHLDDPVSRCGAFKPYSHQMAMLKKAVQDGFPGRDVGNGVWRDGDSFLLPILGRR